MKELECKPKNTSSRCRLGGKINHLKMQWHSVSEMHMHLEVQGFPLLVLAVLTSIWKGAISFIYLFIFLHQKREILPGMTCCDGFVLYVQLCLCLLPEPLFPFLRWWRVCTIFLGKVGDTSPVAKLTATCALLDHLYLPGLPVLQNLQWL